MSPADKAPDVLLVKLGGSLITDKRQPDTLRPEVLRRLAAELAAGWQAALDRGLLVVLGHGSGSFGHAVAAEWGIAEGIESPDQVPGIAHVQAKAAELHRHVIIALRDAGLLPYTIAPSSSFILNDGKPYGFASEVLARALNYKLLPVLYGDVVPDRARGVGICSTETALLAAAMALESSIFPVREALWLGETAGVYDDGGETIPEITSVPQLLEVGRAAGIDVTGGMRHRVQTCLELADLGIPSLIADGTVPGLLERALRGEEVPGTRVPARHQPM